MSTNNEAATRSRSMKRSFVLLRFCDNLKVPRPPIQRALENSGRVKELEFQNNSTTSNVQDIILHAFGQHLSRNEASRLKCYRTVSGSTALTVACTWDDMCGDTLKQNYRNRSKVFMRIDQVMTNRNSDVGSQAHTQDDNAAGQSRSAVEPSNSGSNHDDISIVDRPRQGQSRSAVEPSNSGSNHDDISIVDRPRQDGHSSDDSDLGRPIFASSPIVSRSAADSVVTSCAVVKEGHDLEAQATEVGTIEDEENLLIGAEANPRNGPAFDLELLRKIMAANDLPLVLPFMCRDAREMREQCHADCTPLVLIRYVPTNRAIVILRALLTAADLLGTCYLHASLQGSNFDENACGKHQQSTIQDEVEIRVMHPTLSSNRMIIGSIVAGTERNFLEDVLKAIKQAHEAAKALKAHRDLLERDRALRAEQEQELQASEAADMAKTTAQAKLGALNEGVSLNDTLADTEEVRKRRLEVFAVEASFKRPRDDHSDGDGDGDSGTITFKTQ